MEIPQAPADEFVDAVEDTVNQGRDELATKDDLRNLAAELKQDAAEREARMMQTMLVFVGVILTAIALATGVIIAVVTLT
jgi:hypothetical protein